MLRKEILKLEKEILSEVFQRGKPSQSPSNVDLISGFQRKKILQRSSNSENSSDDRRSLEDILMRETFVQALQRKKISLTGLELK